MKLQTSLLRHSLLLVAALFLIAVFLGTAVAQQTTSAKKEEPTRAKFPAAKVQSTKVADADADADADSQTAKAPKADKDSPDAIRKRDEWFYKQRSSANGHIPAGAHARALAHMQQMKQAGGALVRRPDGSVAEAAPLVSPVTTTWTSIGPTPTTGGEFSPVTGRISSIAIDPTDATGNTVLMGGAQGGIWRTTNAGAAWTAVGDQNSSLSMGSIAFAPSSPTTVYAGTGEQASIGFDIYYGAGVLKSTDSGQTWSPTCTTPSATCPFIGPFSDATPFGFFTFGGARISYIAVNPTNAQMLLAAAQFGTEGPLEGVYCSSNGGTSWNQISSASGEMATFVGFASPTVAFAALGNPFGSTTGQNGIYKSTNANSCSLTFTALTSGLPAETSMGRIDLGISPLFATDNTVYASIANTTDASGSNLGVWVTTNGGTTWTRTAATDICDAQCWYDNVVKVDPLGGAHAFLGGAAITDVNQNPIWVERTTNTGTAWSTVIPNQLGTGLPHVDTHAMAFIKLSTGKIRMYLGNDGGIWRTDDAEATPIVWTNLNDSTLTLTQFYPALSIHPSSPLLAFAGAQDNGSQIYAGPSANWTDNGVCGDGTGTAIDNVIPSTVYVACNGTNFAVSTLNGQPGTFFSAVNGINPGDNSSFVPPLVTDPSTANVLYAGTTKVYQSVNAGTSWTALSGDLVNGANFDELTALTVAPGNPHAVYAGADTGQVFVATNVVAGTGTFAQVAGQASLPPRQVAAITADPADATGKTAYAAFSGFSFVNASVGINDPTGHLFKTTDGGATWTDVSCTVASCVTPAASDLPNTPVNDVVIDPDLAGTLYAATDIGVFQGTCTTSVPFSCTWATLSSGLPRVAVLSLRLHRASRTLRAATHGRGVFDIVLNNFTFPGPHISSLSQVSASAGAAGFTLTVTGNGLTGGTIQFGGTALTPTGTQSDTSLSGTVLAAQLAGGGAPQVTAKVGANTSNGLTFTILGGAPTITNALPAQANVNAAATQITVTGTGFGSNTVALMNPDFNGTPIPTTFVNATTLHATVPASFMANFGSTNSVGVQTPPPGGGTTVTTSTVTLPIFTVVALAPANDNIASATTVTPGAGGLFTNTVDSSGATGLGTDPVPACSQIPGAPFFTGITNTVWYKFIPASSGTITDVDTIGSSYDTVLSIWTGSASSLTAFACNDDIVSGIDIQSQLTSLPVVGGTTYYIMVSSFGPADPNPIALGGETIFNLTFVSNASAPSITSLTPNSGPIGTSVTIAGSNFGSSQSTSTVTFNGTAATPTSWSKSSIVVPVPTGATTGSVAVTVAGVASNGMTFTVTATGSFRMDGPANPVAITAGSNANVAITLTPTGGFTSAGVPITCPTLPPGVHCASLSIPVPNANPAIGQLSVSVDAPAAANATASLLPAERTLYAATLLSARGGKGWWMLSGSTGFAAIILLLLPGRKRFRAALGLGLVCVLSLTLGCSNSGGGGGFTGPVATTTHMTVTSATKGGTGTMFTFTATVTGGTPTDQVQLLDNGVATGAAVAVSGGTAMLSTAALTTVGTHSITAHYVGDATNTGPSSSGPLNVTITGPTTISVAASPAASNGTPAVNITIN